MSEKKIRVISLLILVLLIGSCSKEDAIVYPKVYESASINDVNLRVFTKNGEITNQVNTEKLLEPLNWLFTDIENSTIKGELIITYNSPNELVIQDINTTDIDYRKEYNISGISYWEQNDTTYARSALSEFEKFFTYHPIYQEEKTLLSETHTAYKHCYYAKHENDKLLLPMLDFAVFQYSWAPKSGVGKYKNVFDDATFSKLGVNDTLVVQSYSIEFLPQ